MACWCMVHTAWYLHLSDIVLSTNTESLIDWGNRPPASVSLYRTEYGNRLNHWKHAQFGYTPIDNYQQRGCVSFTMLLWALTQSDRDQVNTVSLDWWRGFPSWMALSSWSSIWLHLGLHPNIPACSLSEQYGGLLTATLLSFTISTEE